MFTNNRSSDESEKDGFRESHKIADEIYELCGILVKQKEDTDDSSPENVSEISLTIPPDKQRCPKQKDSNNSFPEKDENLVKTHSLDAIPFEKQKHSDSPIYSHSDPMVRNHHPGIKVNHFSIPTESKTYKNRRLQADKEFENRTFYEPLSCKRRVIPVESSLKTMPLLSVSSNQFDAHPRDKQYNAGNMVSQDINCYNGINMCDSVLKNDQFSCDSSLHSEDLLSAFESPICSSSQSITGWNKLFHGSRLYTKQQNAFPLNSLEFQNYNSLCRSFIPKADQLSKQYDGQQSHPEKMLSSRKTESKLISLNVSLKLENQRRLEECFSNLSQKTASRISSTPGFIREVERNCLFVQTNWLGRKCKSEIQILQNTKSNADINFLTGNNCKESRFNFSSDILRQSTTSEETMNLNGIPTLRGRKLPAKVSILLLNSPIILNYTEGISGKSQEILMCTNDTIEEIFQNESNIQNQEVVKRLIAKSRPYIGKPIHIIFQPRKAVETPSLDGVDERSPVSLHPSPGKYNLLAEVPSLEDADERSPVSLHPSPGKCNLLAKETDPGKKFDSENNSNATLVANENDQLKGIENRTFGNDSSGFDSTAKRNVRLETFDRFEAKKKLKIRMCRRKKSRTDLKRVNVKQIVSSVFRKFFHFYSLVGGHLRSGSVITKSNSILWLREAGVTTDARSLEVANELFKGIAGAKVVLNIFDFMQFLIQFARRQRMAAVDLIGQLTLCELSMDRQNSETRRLKTFRQSKNSNQGYLFSETISISRSQSLPDLKICSAMLNS